MSTGGLVRATKQRSRSYKNVGARAVRLKPAGEPVTAMSLLFDVFARNETRRQRERIIASALLHSDGGA